MRPSLSPTAQRWAFRLMGTMLFTASIAGSLGVGECAASAGTKVVGEACTRTNECLSGLVCQTGICADADAERRDAGSSVDATATDAR